MMLFVLCFLIDVLIFILIVFYFLWYVICLCDKLYGDNLIVILLLGKMCMLWIWILLDMCVIMV